MSTTRFERRIFVKRNAAEVLRETLRGVTSGVGGTVHDGGTYICVEGPQFSTRAESEIFRSWGVSVIGMTALPEARLAREAEMCYATLAMATDYDCWHPDHDHVSADLVVSNLTHNVQTARAAVAALIPAIASTRNCTCGRALNGSVMISPDQIPAAARERLRPLLERFLVEAAGG